MYARICLLLAGLVISSCSADYAAISERKPVFQPIRSTGRALVSFQQKIAHAAKADPALSLGDYLAAAQEAEQRLKSHPEDQDARDSYNFAVARVFSAFRETGKAPWSQPLEVPTAEGAYQLTYRREHQDRRLWNPALYDFLPADEIEMKGLYVEKHVTRGGLGAPLVAVGKDNDKAARANFGMDKIYYGVTALLDFTGRNCVITFLDPLENEEVRLDGRSHPLAADFTTPLAVMLARSNPKGMELPRLLRPQKYAETARVSRIQPYDPNKTVVLVIHGLKDSPATWAPMINSLWADKEIRTNYQFWFYSYPSGYPYPYSAAILRKELDAAEKRFSLKHKMVVIGHSMGGCISRLLITDADEKLWMDYFGKKPSQVSLTPQTKRLVEESLIFDHRSEIGRVIFISAPLKGSDLASGWPGRIGSWLIKAPFTLINVGNEAFKAVVTTGDSLKVNGMPNSVDTLAPNNRFVMEINKLPLAPGIPYHTIMGDRGKGGNHDKTRPVQSDGIVPYWSSHMAGAESELVVPSSHSAHQNEQAMEEVERILRLHQN
ncbi:MAG: hypothetical protein V4640_15355 [Verrucomicrobiota bacterium]